MTVLSLLKRQQQEVLLEAPAGAPQDDGPHQDGPGDGSDDDVGAGGPWRGGERRRVTTEPIYREP